MTGRSAVIAKGRKTVPVKWVLKSKEEYDRLICLKSINVFKQYMQVPGVDFIESFSPVASDTSIMIMIGLTVYHEDKGLVADICDVIAAFLHPNM